MMKKQNIPAALALCLLFAAFVAAALSGGKDAPVQVSYTAFLDYVHTGQVAQTTLTDSPNMAFTLQNDSTPYTTHNPRLPHLKETLLLAGVDVKESGANSANSAAKALAAAAFVVGMVYLISRFSGRTGAKQAMALELCDVSENLQHALSFHHVAGNEEAKESVADIVDFIKNPQKYAQYGARVPRGILFYGPPGTGKTLMAKAVAGEAGVPFYAVSGSDFVQMYVGVGAGRIRSLFKKAREKGRAVIFIDEIDALGKKRSSRETSGGQDERDQTLNALLTEMSGFSTGEGVIVIAATNRPDTLDDALLRPGRFDRQVEIGLPDVHARASILAYHAKNKPLSTDVSLEALAKETVYFSGAMLENLLNEAAILSAKADKNVIDKADLDKAYYTLLAGSEKKNRRATFEKERRVTAIHEAGHALVGKVTTPDNAIAKITIIPSTKGAGGFCVHIPAEKAYYTKQELKGQIMMYLGGRAAEALMLGEDNVTTGAVNDLEKATAMAMQLIGKYGMGEENGLLTVSRMGDTAQLNKECRQLLDSLYAAAMDILKARKDQLDAVVRALLEKESLNEEEFNALVA